MEKKPNIIKACLLSGPVIFLLLLSTNFIHPAHLLSPSEQPPPPTARFTFELSGDCMDQAVKFTSTSEGEEISHSWNFDDPYSGSNNSSTSSAPSHTFAGNAGNGSQSFNVTLTVTDTNGQSSSASQRITLKQIPSLEVGSDRDGTSFDNLAYFIVCENGSSDFTFYNNSTTKTTNEKYVIDWGDGSPKHEVEDWTSATHTYAQGIYRITYSVTGENGCVASKQYGIFVGSNPAVGLENPGNTNICTGETLSFPITGTENNPPGTIYTVTFSDGSDPQVFTHPPPASVAHVFHNSSCGEFGTDFRNSFSAKIIAANPCSASSATVAPIYATEKPVPEMDLPEEPVCVDTPTTLENITVYGNEVSNNGDCSSQGRFVWQISPATGWELSGGTLGSQGDPNQPNSWEVGSKVLRPVFHEPGTYTITLISGNRCGIDQVQETICVMPKPEPTFSLDLEEGCGPLQVATTNTSNTLGLCGAGSFLWNVSYTRGDCGTQQDWEFAAGFNENSESPVFNFNNPGEYTIRLTALASCGNFSEEKTVTVYAPPTAEILGLQDLCGPGTLHPRANVKACGTEDAVYQWTFEDGTPSTSSMPDPGEVSFDSPGEKTISLEVISSCGTVTVTETVRVNEVPVLDIGEDQEICLGETVTLHPIIVPEADYSYRWTSTPAGMNSSQANPEVSPLQTTTYSLEIINRETQCVVTDQVTLVVIPAPVVEFSIPDQTLCSGESSLPVALFSDAPGATFAWTAEANGVRGVVASGTGDIPSQVLVNHGPRPLSVTYSAIISESDQGQCRVVPAQYTITVNPSPSIENAQVEICSGSPWTYLPENHQSGWGYTWTARTEGEVTGIGEQSSPQASLTQTLVNRGNNPVTVIYEVRPLFGTCSGDEFELAVTVQPAPAIDFSVADQVICSGNQSAEVILFSEVPGATFSWTANANGALGVTARGDSNRIPIQTLVNPGDRPIVVEYEITASTSSQSSCEGIPQLYTITVNPAINPDPVVSDFSGYAISCFGAMDGSIDLNLSGGDGDYIISWTGPDGYGASEPVIRNLGPGHYRVSVRDGSGCEFTDSFVLEEPDPLGVRLLEQTDVLCAGDSTGAIAIEVFGGVQPENYAFTWTRNGENFPRHEQHLTGIPAGTYELTVADVNGCSVTSGPVIITEPDNPLAIAIDKGDISCYNANDGFINIEPSGGLPPYTIRWDFGSDHTDFENLGPGIYTVTVQDRVGCTLVQAIEIVDAPLFEINPAVNNISCHGQQDGSIQLNLGGKGPDVLIRWDHGPQLESLFNLPQGSYGVTITEPEGCQIRQEFVILEPAPLVVEARITDALDCLDPQSGSIQLAVSGGTPPLTFTWSHGETTQSLENLTSGTYGITVSDASGCRVVRQFEVKRPDPLTLAVHRFQEVSCQPREIREEFRVSASGGVAPYKLSWSGGLVSEEGKMMTAETPGFYQVQVVDGNGCIYQESFEVKNPDVIVDIGMESTSFEIYNANLVNFDTRFINRSSGQIIAYYWDFGDGNTSREENPVHRYLSEGKYEITLSVTDVYGCTTQTKKNIEVWDYFLVVPNAFTPNGDGLNDHFFPKFLNIQAIDFWVLNKWGETVFHSRDLESQGWDGQVNGEPAMPGNYVYKLVFQTLDGRSLHKTDVFLLLK